MFTTHNKKYLPVSTRNCGPRLFSITISITTTTTIIIITIIVMIISI